MLKVVVNWTNFLREVPSASCNGLAQDVSRGILVASRSETLVRQGLADGV